jgi:uracil-DNA glycosylase
MPTMNAAVEAVLMGAYMPCPAFGTACRGMRWAHERGHVPRGFCGATGPLADVQLVLVGAEPGDPHDGENHVLDGTPVQRLESAYAYAYECFRSGKDLYHRNMQHLLTLCWPNESVEEHLRKVWITDSVLCSAAVEGGPVPAAAARECRARYLEAELALFPGALVVALGGKAQKRLAGLSGVVKAFAVAPPGCNFRGARESWAEVARLVQSRAT